MHDTYPVLGMAGVGFFGMLLIGFLAGWIAERVMNRDHGLLTNILVGIAGSFVGGTAASLVGIRWYGFMGSLVIATLGAIVILWFFGRSERAGHRGPYRKAEPGDWPRAPGDAQGDEKSRGTPIYHLKDDEI